jgi:hypothetical protein
MKIIPLLAIGLSLSLYPIAISARPEPSQARTIVNNSTALRQLLGKHKLNLQWIGWDKWSDFGSVRVFDSNGTLMIKGQQTKDNDLLSIDGKITRVDAKEFTFQGRIVTQVSHNNQGKPCERDGVMVFKITNNRKYWRLQQMQSPCGTETDYVDIFMR